MKAESHGGRRRVGVTHVAIEAIRKLIASGQRGPGTRLPRESDLAAQLGLSTSSLREAVRALSLARVLEVTQSDGTFVSSPEPSELLEPTLSATYLMRGRTVLALFEVRRLLEPEAALAALRAHERMYAACDRAEHTDIYDAIVAGDPDLARAEALIHIAHNETWLREHLGPTADIPLSDKSVD